MGKKGRRILTISALAAAAMTAWLGMSALAAFPDGIEIRKTVLNGYDEATSMRYGSGYVQTIGLGENDASVYPELARGLKDYSDALKTEKTKDFNEMIETAKEFYEETSENREIYLDVDMLPRRSDDAVFSFLEYYSDYSGGAHGYYMYTAHNFDTATGQEITLDQVVTDENAFRNAVNQALMEKYPDSSIGTLGTTLDDFGSGEGQYPFNWLLVEDGVAVYFNPYAIGSYAEGVFDVTLRFEDYPDLFTGQYQEAQGGCVNLLEPWKEENIDLDGDGVTSALRIGMDYGEDNDYGGNIWYDGLSVYVGDASCTAGNLGFYAAEPFLMRTADGKYYLYVVISMENDYRQTIIFGFMGNSPYQVGTVDGGFGSRWDNETDEIIYIYPSDPEHFVMDNRGSLLSSYSISRNYCIGDDGMPQPLEEIYTCNTTYPLHTIKELPAQPVNTDTLEPEGDVIQVPAGEDLYIRYSDGSSEVYMERPDGSMVRVTVEGGKWPHTIDGVDESEYFETQYYAG